MQMPVNFISQSVFYTQYKEYIDGVFRGDLKWTLHASAATIGTHILWVAIFFEER